MGPSRTSHRKSREGCTPLHRRAPKCPEQRPRCSNCIRLDRTCTWPEAVALKRVASEGQSRRDRETPSASHCAATTDTSSRHQGDTDELPLQDLRLLHHYVSKTSSVLDECSDPQILKIWQDTVVQIAFEYPFLLHGILAISALHLAHEYPAERESFLLQSFRHLEPSLRVVKSSIAKPADAATPALFACACLLVIHSFGVGALEKPQDPIGSILGIVQLIRGVSAVLRSSWDTVHGVQLSALEPLVAGGLSSGVPGHVAQITALKQQVASLSQFDIPFAERSACLEALDHLEAVVLKAKARSEEKQESALAILFSWPVIVSEEFMPLVAQRRQVPLAIMAHFVIRLGVIGQCWWLQGCNTRLTNQVERMLCERLRVFLVCPTDDVEIAATVQAGSKPHQGR
ncbi:uncharacterized protein Z518_01796 [Rhinocladiella mackenziei CBS 650.93]|uniref:Zn(2)-C6 fungal-type domain-containing protein n=1 Tax=Rhinocladiella mackenziei CBS 650.93 TaxID=1442369 RepID=A0A0D2G6W6_9EURO|nr:uncharacterized protein Z518_01796 [Rhinocladiella mackenziei CBS 650.93]KIX10712.1 hypothetical protein Z518_01796 [Rhinocladiella mackenziei CBS 650.93]